MASALEPKAAAVLSQAPSDTTPTPTSQSEALSAAPGPVSDPAQVAALGPGRKGEALKWRIDVEDYVSEDNASVVDDILEGLNMSSRENSLSRASKGQAPAAEEPMALMSQQDASAAKAEAAHKAEAAAASKPVSPPSAAPAPAPSSAPALADGPNPDLAALYAQLKETRERPSANPMEAERKAAEVAALQARLKEVRARSGIQGTEADEGESAGTSGARGAAELAGRLPAGVPRRQTIAEETSTAVRRVASAGPPGGLTYSGPLTSDMISGYGALSTAPGTKPLGPSVSGGQPIERTFTSTSALTRGPPRVQLTQSVRDPHFDPRNTLGFSEAQARAMGLIHGPTAAGNAEPKADGVAHMQWKAHHGSSRPPATDRAGQYEPAPEDGSLSKSKAGSVYGGDSRSVYGDGESVYEGGQGQYVGDARSAYGESRSVYGDEQSAWGEESRAAGAAPVVKSPWRSSRDMLPIYRDQQVEEAQGPIVDHSDAYSTVSGAYFRAPPGRSVPPSEVGDLQVALSYRTTQEPARRTGTLSRRLGQLSLLGDEGVTIPEMPEPAFDDTKSVKSVVTAVTAAPAQEPAPVGTVDIQMFNRLVREMREEGQNISKLKQQNKLLQGWYADSKAWADEKSLRALEAMIIADDAEDVAAMKHKLLKDLDERLMGLKDKMAGLSMLEQENRQLRTQLNQMTNTKAPESLLQQFKAGPRADLVLQNVLPGSSKTAKKDLETLALWMEEMQEDGGQVQRLQKLNRLLQGWYADANSRAEDAIAREREEFKRAKEAEELAAAGDLLILEMEAKHSEMRMKLAARQMLEQENRELRSKIIALSSAKGPNVPVQKQQAILLEALEENLGFNQGRPIMACIVYKAMVHWSMIEVERLNTFDCVMEIQDRQCKHANPDIHSYWISNAVHMLFLATRGPTRIDSSVAKSQLSTATSRLYLTIRDNVKEQLSAIINQLLQPPPMPMDDNMTDVGSVVSGTTSVLHKLVPSGGNVRRQMTSMWENAIGALRQLVDVLRANYVPPFIVRELLSQLLQFMDFKLFNAVMMHSPWVPCTLTNAETMDAGLQDLEDWLANVDDWLNSSLKETISLTSQLSDNICHLKEATVLLLDENKPKRTLRGIQRMCHHLSMTQLAHICTWFEDDKDGLPGVEPQVIEQMWSLMHEDQPFLLKEDKSCPFTGEEVCRSMKEFSLDDIEPPQRLRSEDAFHFLVPAAHPSAEYEKY